ncbi:MAG: DUF1792 domain-containing protein [Treponema sp.]|nr:DUF1792 domain-containing protein [Treponema sp.]
MYSIIVFSKDRPLQLHAYLESLQHFSDAKLETISVLYCKTPNVNYEKVINAFPQIQWIEENNFYTNLLSLVSTAKDKILFGCDDVVFTDHFSIETASSVLDTNDQIFGFSFRLGTNIQPLPYKHAVVENNIIWNWMIADTNQYNYPWELDCTLYRKTDIEQMIAKLGKQINNPNYFEEYFAVSPLDYINKPLMACSNKKNNAVVITVNRVQETHKNAVDENSITNVHYLNKIYNENGNTLDILKISKLPRNIIHVDRTYFILRNKIKQIRNENKYIKKLKQLIKNVKFILNHSLSELNKQSPNETANTYELIQLIKDTKLPKIKNSFDTIEELLNTNKSFCRFGDGEISLIYNNSIPFQKSNHLIAARLKEIIKSSSDSIMIGIGYYYFYPEISLFHT